MQATTWWCDPYWWTNAIAAAGTVGAVVIALFGERLRHKFFPPRFSVRLKAESGERTTAHLRDLKKNESRTEDARYYHLTVSNRGPVANNTAVYVTGVWLVGAGGEWYQAWTGEIPLSWRHGELYPILRPVGLTPLDADFFSLIKGKWLDLCVIARPNALPSNTMPPFQAFPGRWRQAIELRVVVQAKSTEGESTPLLLHVDWDGGWADGDSEIMRHLHIRQIANLTGS